MNKLTFFVALFFCVGIWGCEDKEENKDNTKDYEVVATGKLEEFTEATICMSYDYLLIRKSDTLYLAMQEEVIHKAPRYNEKIVTIYGNKSEFKFGESCPLVIKVEKISKE